MNYFISSSAEILPPPGYEIILTPNVRATASTYRSLPNSKISIAVSDPALAHLLKIKVWRNGALIDGKAGDFFKRLEQNGGKPSQDQLSKVAEATTISTTSIKRIKVTKLDEAVWKDMQARRGVILLKAQTGAGKTRHILEPFFEAEVASGLAPSFYAPRINITESFQRRHPNSIALYSELTPEDLGRLGEIGVCSTIHSSWKPCVQAIAKAGGTVFIDEAQKVFEAISRTDKLIGRLEILAELRRIIREAECLVLVDADLNQLFLDFILAERKAEDVCLYEMEQDYSDVKINLHEDYGQLISNMNDDVLRGEKVLFCSDSKRTVEAQARVYRKLGYKGLVVTRDNKGHKAQKAFFDDPNAEIVKYDFICYSPVMSSSLSITYKHFTRHYALATGILTPAEFIQMMRRDRTALLLNIAMNLPQNFGAWEHAYTASSDDSVLSAVREQARYLAETTRTSLPATLALLNFDVAEVDSAKNDGRAALANAKQALDAEYLAGVTTAEIISNKATLIEMMNRSDRLTEEERYSLDATNCSRLTGKNDEEAHYFYQRGAGARKMKLLKATTITREDAEQLDFTETGLASIDKTQWSFLNQLLSPAIEMLTSDDGYSVKDAYKVVNSLQEAKNRWNPLNIRRVADGKVSQRMALRICGDLLKAFGYTHARHGKGRGEDTVYIVTNKTVIHGYLEHAFNY